MQERSGNETGMALRNRSGRAGGTQEQDREGPRAGGGDGRDHVTVWPGRNGPQTTKSRGTTDEFELPARAGGEGSGDQNCVDSSPVGHCGGQVRVRRLWQPHR